MSVHPDSAAGETAPVQHPRALKTIWGWALFALVCYGLSGIALALHWMGTSAPASLESQYVLVYHDQQLLHAKAREICSAREAGDDGSAKVRETEYNDLAAGYDSAYGRAFATAGAAPHDLPAQAPALEYELAALPCR